MNPGLIPTTGLFREFNLLFVGVFTFLTRYVFKVRVFHFFVHGYTYCTIISVISGNNSNNYNSPHYFLRWRWARSRGAKGWRTWWPVQSWTASVVSNRGNGGYNNGRGLLTVKRRYCRFISPPPRISPLIFLHHLCTFLLLFIHYLCTYNRCVLFPNLPAQVPRLPPNSHICRGTGPEKGIAAVGFDGEAYQG
jgi:hypothetical protein